MNQISVIGMRLVRQFQEELKSSPRLVRLVWLVVYFTLCLLVLSIFDVNQRLGSDAKKMLSDLARVSGIGEKELWTERLERHQVYQSEMLRYCSEASNPGLASADIQTFLQKLLVRYNVRNSRLTVSEPELAGKSLGRINAQITGRIERGDLLPLLNRLEDSSNFFSVARFGVTFSGQGDAIDLLVSSCFQMAKK